MGAGHVLTDKAATRRYRKGFRFGEGPALAVVRPGSLVEMWRVLGACAEADKIILVQAANTGLTGGSTPDGDGYDREIVIISTLRLARIHLIKDGAQVVCLPGATLYQLEKALKSVRREPHSVIGSSCIGASVFGGVCNNSGGALIHRGPAFTQMTLFARIDEGGRVHLVNHLGIRLGGDPETILRRVEAGDFAPADIEDDPNAQCSDHDYQQHVRNIEADTPARFNADPRRLFEASGSAGKVMVLAVRLDTFPAETRSAVFYIGTNDPDELTKLAPSHAVEVRGPSGPGRVSAPGRLRHRGEVRKGHLPRHPPSRHGPAAGVLRAEGPHRRPVRAPDVRAARSVGQDPAVRREPVPPPPAPAALRVPRAL